MRCLLSSLMVLLLVRCEPKRAPAPVSEPPPTITPIAPPPPAAPTMLQAHARPKREALVGGCSDDCKKPRQALTEFLRHVLARDGTATIKPFLDTSMLTHNTRDLGTPWAELFKDRKLDVRKSEIETWVAEWAAWSERIVDPNDRVVVERAFTTVEENQSRYVVDYQHPDLAAVSGARPLRPIWRITLAARGLEWLVVSIEDAETKTP